MRFLKLFLVILVCHDYCNCECVLLFIFALLCIMFTVACVFMFCVDFCFCSSLPFLLVVKSRPRSIPFRQVLLQASVEQLYQLKKVE